MMKLESKRRPLSLPFPHRLPVTHLPWLIAHLSISCPPLWCNSLTWKYQDLLSYDGSETWRFLGPHVTQSGFSFAGAGTALLFSRGSNGRGATRRRLGKRCQGGRRPRREAQNKRVFLWPTKKRRSWTSTYSTRLRFFILRDSYISRAGDCGEMIYGNAALIWSTPSNYNNNISQVSMHSWLT